MLSKTVIKYSQVGMGVKKELTLFGGDKGWHASNWTASDDRVRGGKSQSYLDISDSKAHFHGNLDIKTLGGAGFASQRTKTEDETWDLSDYEGIIADFDKSDGKQYTFILKDELLPKNPENGREQSTISYEYDFCIPKGAPSNHNHIFVPWKGFKATYRGKEKKHAPKLDEKIVKRFSIMMRSFFGDQEGDFSLTIKSIKAVSLREDVQKGLPNEAISLRGDVEKGLSNEPSEVNPHGKFKYTQLFNKRLVLYVLGFGLVTYGVCAMLCPGMNHSNLI